MASFHFVLLVINLVIISSTKYKVLVEEASGLEDMDDDIGWFTNDSDPYVVVYGMGARSICVSQTSTKDGTLSPYWNQVFECEFEEGLPNERCENFQFKLWDEDLISADDHMGTTERFYVSDVKKCDEWYVKTMEVWLNGECKGTLNVAVSQECEEQESKY